MVGLTLHSSTNTNELHLHIPDELKGVALQIIIIPAEQDASQKIEFFSDAELQQLPVVNLSNPIQDDEDYTKW